MITDSQYSRSNFRLFRHVDNSLDFLIRDVDRQPVAPTGTITLHIWDLAFSRELLTKTLTAVNAPKGHYRVTVTATEATDFPLGNYAWTVSTNNNGVDQILYANANYGPRGTVEVVEGLLPDEPAAQELDPSTFLLVNTFYHSSALLGAAKVNNRTGNHSLALYMTAFTGDIRIEVSLDSAAPQDETGWILLSTNNYSDSTGTISLNFTSNCNYVRLSCSSISGLEKIIYRN